MIGFELSHPLLINQTRGQLTCALALRHPHLSLAWVCCRSNNPINKAASSKFPSRSACLFSRIKRTNKAWRSRSDKKRSSDPVVTRMCKTWNIWKLAYVGNGFYIQRSTKKLLHTSKLVQQSLFFIFKPAVQILKYIFLLPIIRHIIIFNNKRIIISNSISK